MNNTKKEKIDTVASCTHDEITQFITQLNKTDYIRNPFTGALDIINDVVKEIRNIIPFFSHFKIVRTI